MTLSITESNICKALGDFLTSILPGVTIRQGQQNRLTLPAPGTNWLVFTPLLRTRLALNIDDYSTTSTVTTKSLEAYMQVTVQTDCYGPAASDNAQTICTMFRDEFASAFFEQCGFDIAPLYTADPRNLTFINDQSQYEERWNVDCVLAANIVSTAGVQSTETLGPVGIVSVDVKYPPIGAP